MGFEVFFQFYAEAETEGIPRAAVRSLFPVDERESEPDYWSVRYDAKNTCNIGVIPLESDPQLLTAMYVERPCADVRVWEGMLSVLRMGAITLFWPGGPPVIGLESTASELPADMIDSIGQPRMVCSPSEILQILKES